MSRIRPIIGVVTSVSIPQTHSVTQYASGERNVRAVSGPAGGAPVLIPALGEDLDLEAMVDMLDGLFLTGGRANIEPHHYGGPPFPDDETRDPARDATVLPLVRACVETGVPVFGTCRGIQELNVALGGSLHYRLHQVPGFQDHRMVREGDMEFRMGLRHPISMDPEGLFAHVLGATEVMVNSLHGQGVDRLGDGLVVDAMAPDGVVEGIRLEGGKGFAVGVQWHAEWRPDDHPLSAGLLREFGLAAEARRARRRASVAVP